MGSVRLETLSLVGFKSFPDEVQLHFPGEICAIIGPNGCGKSNVVDAILWVLGEQSPSLLRLKQMGDVVFSGAAGRQPAGAAEVTLTLRSDDSRWADTDGRLEVRRRVYRSGPSEYRLNGRVARLKDVMDELLAVGLGTRGYSIIEQGRVGQVLSARPVDRRLLLEEAAGITRYKARRHEAELKLEHTRQNLLRLDDVIGEVDRSLRQLRRQARQAERHQQLEEKLRDLLGRLHALQAREIDGRRQETIRRRARLQNETAAAAASLAGAEADLADARRAAEAARGELDGVREEVAGLSSSRDRLEAFLERSADLLDSLRTSLETTRRESVSMVADRDRLDGQATEAARRLDAAEEALADVREHVERATSEEQEARSRAASAEAEAGRLRQDLLRTISALTNGRNRLGDLDRERDRVAYALRQGTQEIERVRQRRDEVSDRCGEAREASQAATAAADALEDRRAELRTVRGEVQEQAGSARHDAETLAHQAWEVRHRLGGIERELARHGAAVDQLAMLVPADAVDGQVSDHLHPEAGVAELLDRVWAEWLELPVLRAASLGPDQRERLGELEGRVRVVLASGIEDPVEHPTPDGCEDLLARAGAPSADLPWLTRTLPASWLAREVELARRVADDHPEAVVVDPDGVLWRGRVAEVPAVGGDARGALALRHDREQLTAELASISARSEKAGSRARSLTTRLDELDERLRAADRELVTAEEERARTAAVEQSLSQDLGRLEREVASLEAEAERTRQQSRELEERRERLLAEVEGLEGRNLELEQQVESAVARMEQRRDEAAEALRRLDRWQAEGRLAEERAAAARSEAERVGRERRSAMDRIEVLEQEANRLAGQLDDTEAEVVRSRTRLTEEHGLLAAARDRERSLSEGLARREQRMGVLEREVRSRREAHERVRDELHESDVELTRVQSEWDRLRDVALADLGLAPEQLLQRDVGADDSIEDLGGEVERMRAQIERLGPVNLLALKEVAELEERSTFLKAQRKDLVESLGKLDETIRDIDAVCMERFVDTFEKVNAILAETFSQLFGGGAARLDLVDEDNPLESGIDITAQPPGKKNQSVQLLSGGEKALTALSLLISLFRIKPSPFCILDEVDAPLDDANVERLADLVRAMTEHTQFVMITHNRRTMQRADILYGVTMEEPGVSKVVSVRLED